MTRSAIVLLVALANIPSLKCDQTLEIVTRQDWGARPPKERELSTPATLVVIHHSYIPPACSDRKSCVQAMRSMQDFHMDTQGWNDIGYNFAIGGDAVYEGRGWEVVGAHAKGYNNHSLGIVFIGDYTKNLPTKHMFEMCESLIQLGLSDRHIEPYYQLVGHRQVRATECPGDALYTVVQGWDHWVPEPTGVNVTTVKNGARGIMFKSLLFILVLTVSIFKSLLFF